LDHELVNGREKGVGRCLKCSGKSGRALLFEKLDVMLERDPIAEGDGARRKKIEGELLLEFQ